MTDRGTNKYSPLYKSPFYESHIDLEDFDKLQGYLRTVGDYAGVLSLLNEMVKVQESLIAHMNETQARVKALEAQVELLSSTPLPPMQEFGGYDADGYPDA